MTVETIAISALKPDPRNARKHSARNLEAIKASLARFGQQKPIVVDRDGLVRAGNGTLEAAKMLGWTEIKIVRSGLAGPEATAYAISDNRSAELAEWDGEVLAALMAQDEIGDVGFTDDELAQLVAANPLATETAANGKREGSLQARFGVPPFSVLDARQGYWQERKRAWLVIGIKSELGRGGIC